MDLPVCENTDQIIFGFHLEPDGKFVRYIGYEDDSYNIVSYYIPIERHNAIMNLTRQGTSYAIHKNHRQLHTDEAEFHDELRSLEIELYELQKKEKLIREKIKKIYKNIDNKRKDFCSKNGHDFDIATYRRDKLRVGYNAICVDCEFSPSFGETDEFISYVKKESELRHNRDNPAIEQIRQKLLAENESKRFSDSEISE